MVLGKARVDSHLADFLLINGLLRLWLSESAQRLFTKCSKMVLLIPIFSLLLSYTSHARATIVVTVQPLADIVSALVDGKIDVDVLIDANQDPHAFALKPSDLEKLERAQGIVWLGPESEPTLTKLLNRMNDTPPVSVRVVG